MKGHFFKLSTIILCCSLYSVEIKAQKTDSVYQVKPLRFTQKQLIIPSILIIAGFGANGNGRESIKNELVEERNEIIPRFKTSLDDYLQFSPIALTYGLEAIGMKPKTDISNRSVILLKSELVMMAAVTVLKNTSHILRPDSSAYTSFPSGHTAQAFAAAAILSEEYGYRYKWVPYLSYGLASIVGGFRMANNKHYLSDVLVAAGIGILSTKLAYWTHRYKWGRAKNSNHAILL
ncbi:phospholipid phosphatase [Niastella vici]|uniref:Phospholipid phosphatase n=1 Tax=Niastella vici TaxID=1703345 RepID=A0A1V9FPL7_9BACT|nr:phosphatase PAP2 family protein [Niastella vici]OQP60196.1 phospholipid phosphatase [Niastella vici]